MAEAERDLPGDLALRVRAGERAALARAITLVESGLAADARLAASLLERLLPATGGAIRLGVSGAPGVGKSTFIEAFGGQAIGCGHRLAVLAVDPSSRRGGGAILADKTRMQALSRAPEAFIRPSPAGATLGGVARRTREAMLLCEAAGFDRVIVETVGVGQSETAVAGMVDSFLLLLAPGGGDMLQGIKRGIVEHADLIVVTKADGALLPDARRAAADYASALRLLRPRIPGWTPPVLLVSALEGTGIAEVWQAVEAHLAQLAEAGGMPALRARQALCWLDEAIEAELLQALGADPGHRRRLEAAKAEVAAGRRLPATVARELVEVFLAGPRPPG